MNRVAIIGAGASGLISIKTCLENGLLPTCFEMSSDIGGLWNYNESYVSEKGSVMRSTVINSSKENMAFSDYPAPKEFANFMHNSKVLEYFRLYAQEFDLLRHIKFNTKILQIRQSDDYETSGNWYLKYKKEGDDEKDEVFNYVMICIGHHAYPYIPEFKGLNDVKPIFKGEYLHSVKYRSTGNDFQKYLNKNVLVIGVGNSGGDIACELSRICKKTYLSTRSGVWVAPRSSNGGRPTDYTYITRFLNLLEYYSPYDLSQKFLHHKLNSFFDHDLYCVRPGNKNLLHHVFVNDDLPNRIASGTLAIKSNVAYFDGPNSCVFDDDSKIDQIDAVILATGYQIGFPLLDSSIINVNENWVDLYKYVFPTHHLHHTLAVLGCIQPRGSINPIVEIQARWICQVFNKKVHLPTQEVMRQDIKRKQDEIKVKYFKSPRHTIQVELINYMDEIAELIGCKPNLLKYFLTDFKLWYQLVFKGFIPYQYRLDGPNAKHELARKLLFSANERIEYPFKTRKIEQHSKTESKVGFFIKLSIILVVFIGLLWNKSNIV